INLDSDHKLMEGTHIFKTQQREPYELGHDQMTAGNCCDSHLPSQRLHPHPSYRPCMYFNNSNDWDICEELRVRELEEVKARAGQMEKTMRWWSDCTANWREKWSKVRAERNKAREEGRQLKIKLETTMKELSALKKINQGLLSEKEEMEAEITWKKKSGFSEVHCMREDRYQLMYVEQKPAKDIVQNKKNLEIQDAHKVYLNNKSVSLEKPSLHLDNIVQPLEDELLHVSALNLHLDETRNIPQERNMRLSLEREVEKLESDLSLWKWKYEELKKSNQEILQQVCWAKKNKIIYEITLPSSITKL
uniref:Coiled-coil domain-containing protein 102B n=1 Tax=Sphenodon punctatus TaxID=8508 RepID=A0A8D0GHI7_SPHPU